MSDVIERLHIIRSRHDRFNRLLTFGFAVFICTVGFFLWYADIPLHEEYKRLTGIVLMIGAAVFYKIPYFAYLFNRRYFKNSSEDLNLMGASWRQYRMRIINTAL